MQDFLDKINANKNTARPNSLTYKAYNTKEDRDANIRPAAVFESLAEIRDAIRQVKPTLSDASINSSISHHSSPGSKKFNIRYQSHYWKSYEKAAE